MDGRTPTTGSSKENIENKMIQKNEKNFLSKTRMNKNENTTH